MYRGHLPHTLVSLPVFGIAAWLGWESTAAQQGVFFSKAALVTFGGAYAVLPYVAQQAVETHAWLSHEQMMAGLALAETTPGPLIMVLQFAGFVGGWQHPGTLSPLGPPHSARRSRPGRPFCRVFSSSSSERPTSRSSANSPGSARRLLRSPRSVVGVMLNLGVKFATHAMWPDPGGVFDPFITVVAAGAFVAMQRFKVGLMPVIGACAMLGLVWRWGLRM